MKLNKEIFRMVLSLTVITVVVAGLLGLVNAVTKEPIAARQAQAREDAMRTVMPDAATFTALDTEYPDGIGAIYTAGDAQNVPLGWVVEITASGFNGAVGITVGILGDGTVRGVGITSHSETAGLGARLTESWFTAQFEGLASGITVTKNGAAGNQIDAITGATITSQAVADAVNDALAAVGGLEVAAS